MLGWLLGLLWLTVLKAWLGSHVALDADALGVADLWNSLHSGGHLGDWIMGPHPYVFPDLPIYGLGTLWATDTLGRQVAYGMVQGFLLWWFLGRLIRRLGDWDASVARAYAAAGLLILLPLASDANALGRALAPGYHGGALLCALAFLSWGVNQERHASSWASALWAALLVGSVWASDQIVPVWVLAPGLLLSVGLRGRARRKIWAAAVLSCVVRVLVLWLWERGGMQVAHFRWAYFLGHSADLLGSSVHQLLPALGTAAAAIALALLAVGLLIGRARVHALEAWLAAAVLLAALGSLALAGLEGSVDGRYFLGFVWLSVPLLPLLCGLFLQGRPLPLAAAALLGLLCLNFYEVPQAPSSAVVQAQWLDSRFASRGLKQGLADYSHARPLRLLSRQGLELTPVAVSPKGLNPYAWIVDRRSLVGGNKVQFVVLNGLDPAAVRGALGAPLGQVDGAGLSVWIYARSAVPSSSI